MEADLLLHVVDAANPMRDQQIADVNLVLAEIGAENINQVIIHNKIDQLEDTPLAAVLRDESGKIRECRVSALQGIGLAEVRETIKEYGMEDQASKADTRLPRQSRFEPAEIT